MKTKYAQLSILITFFFTTILHAQSLVPYLQNGKYGFSNLAGEIKINCVYDEINYFYRPGYAFVRTGSDWRLIDSLGNHIPAINHGAERPFIRKISIRQPTSNRFYEIPELFQAVLYENKKWGIINFKTNFFSGYKYFPFGTFDEMAKVRTKRYPEDMKYLTTFLHGACVVEKGKSKFNVIDTTGVELLSDDMNLSE